MQCQMRVDFTSIWVIFKPSLKMQCQMRVDFTSIWVIFKPFFAEFKVLYSSYLNKINI